MGYTSHFTSLGIRLEVGSYLTITVSFLFLSSGSADERKSATPVHDLPNEIEVPPRKHTVGKGREDRDEAIPCGLMARITPLSFLFVPYIHSFRC